MTMLQYNGPDTDELKRGGIYDRSAHPEIDDELWCTPAFAEPQEGEDPPAAPKAGDAAETGD